MKNDSSIPDQKCPKCGHLIDATTCVEGGHNPKPGNVSICLYCGDIRIFDEALRLVSPSERVQMEIEADPMVTRAQILIAGRKK